MSELIHFDGQGGSEEEPATCYAGLPEETIQSLEAHLVRIRGIAAQSALEIGRELAAAKKEIPPFKAGGFHAWLRERVGITEQYAYQLISVYAHFGGTKLSLVSQFANTALRLLAAPSAPAAAREEALRFAQQGEMITPQRARELIEAQQQACRDAERARKQLAEEQERSQGEIARLTQRIIELQGEIASLSLQEDEMRAAAREIAPPDMIVRLEHLQTSVQELTAQRDQLSAKAQQLGTDLETLREERDREREQELSAIRLRQRWQKATETFRHHMLKLLGQFPSPLDTQAFESEDWERLSQVQTLARRFLVECDQLRSELPLVVVDAGEAHSP